MEVLSIEPSGRNGKIRVVFGNGTTLFLYKSEALKYGILKKTGKKDRPGGPDDFPEEGGEVFSGNRGETALHGYAFASEIDDTVYGALIEDTIRPRCRTRALHLVAKMDRTESDVHKKLAEGGYPEDIIEDTMAFMEEYHYVDDLEYAKSYFRTYGDTKSLKAIAQKLMEKGLSKETIRTAGEEAYSGSEEDLIRRLLEKRHYDPETADRKERDRTARYLMGKGFSYDSFSRLL